MTAPASLLGKIAWDKFKKFLLTHQFNNIIVSRPIGTLIALIGS